MAEGGAVPHVDAHTHTHTHTLRSKKGGGAQPSDVTLKMTSNRVLFLVLAATAALEWALAASPSVEEVLFESFLANHSRSYRNDPVIKSERFKVFQVS